MQTSRGWLPRPEYSAFVRRPSSAARIAIQLDETRSRNVEVHILVHRHVVEPVAVERSLKNALLPVLRVASSQVGLELLQQQRQALFAAPSMPNRILDGLFQHRSITQLHTQRVGNRALVRSEEHTSELQSRQYL